MKDPLLAFVDSVPIPYVATGMGTYEPELFLDIGRFHYCIGAYTKVDVATYSTSLSKSTPIINIDRLIVGLVPTNPTVLKSANHIRWLINNHLKLYLCYSGKSLRHVYIGSLNLTFGTNLNLVYRVRQKHNKPLAQLYNRMWRAAKPLDK